MMSPASISTQSVPVAPSMMGFLKPASTQFFLQMRRHGGDLPVGEAGGDHHAVGEAGAAGEVDGDDVLGLVVLQAGDDDRCMRSSSRPGSFGCGLLAARAGDAAFLRGVPGMAGRDSAAGGPWARACGAAAAVPRGAAACGSVGGLWRDSFKTSYVRRWRRLEFSFTGSRIQRGRCCRGQT